MLHTDDTSATTTPFSRIGTTISVVAEMMQARQAPRIALGPIVGDLFKPAPSAPSPDCDSLAEGWQTLRSYKG